MTATYFAMLWGGNRWMRTRQAVRVKGAMRVYNMYQTVVNGCLVLGFLQAVRIAGMRYWGSGVDRSMHGRPLGFLLYAHYRNKYLEYADHAFLRRGQNLNRGPCRNA